LFVNILCFKLFINIFIFLKKKIHEEEENKL
jgi:hypothetical protein